MLIAPPARLGLPALRWMSTAAFPGEALAGAIVLLAGVSMSLRGKELLPRGGRIRHVMSDGAPPLRGPHDQRLRDQARTDDEQTDRQQGQIHTPQLPDPCCLNPRSGC